MTRHETQVSTIATDILPKNLQKVIEGMSVAHLTALIHEVEARKTEKVQTEAAVVKQKVLDLVEEHGFTLEQLFPPAKRGRKTADGKGVKKYADPADPKRTWSGLGRRPNWINEFMANNGDDLSAIEIKT